jgi:hypothetical protein
MNRSKLLTRIVLFIAMALAVAVTQTSTGKLRTTQANGRADSRPFRMLVLGDSVMWGQGLSDNNKFSHLVAKWVCEQRNAGNCPSSQDVDLHVEAHSGAVLAAPKSKSEEKEEQDCLQENSPLRCHGEVPNAYPTIWSQVDLALRHYSKNQAAPETIDLILVDGGINDLGAPKILLPVFGGNITDQARTYCYDPMKKLLAKAHSAFPNAIIVVAGYFPLVSNNTPLDIVSETFRDLFPHISLHSADKNALKESAKAQQGIAEPAIAEGMFETLPERSKKWKNGSDAFLRQAVEEFNETQTQAGGKAPAVFAGIKFADENAYAAAHSFLWQLGPKGTASFACPDYLGVLAKILGNLIVNDEQQSTRPCACILAGVARGGEGIFCMRAGAFHPNIFGAKAYAEAIERQLQTLHQQGSFRL